LSTTNIYDYVTGETYTVTKLKQEASGTGIVYLKDEYTNIPLAFTSLKLYDDASGTTELVLNTDFTIEQIDSYYTTEEGTDVYRGYKIINATYQSVPVYADADIVGGYNNRLNNYKYITLSSDVTTTIDKEWKNTIIVADTGCTTVTINKTSSVDLSNKIQVFNESGSAITVTDGVASYNLNNGINDFYWYNGSNFLNINNLAPNAIYNCKAWFQFDGTGTPSLKNSYNVSSISDIGTGVWTVNLSTTVSTDDCVVVSNQRIKASGSIAVTFGYIDTTTSVSIRATTLASGAVDCEVICGVIFSA